MLKEVVFSNETMQYTVPLSVQVASEPVLSEENMAEFGGSPNFYGQRYTNDHVHPREGLRHGRLSRNALHFDVEGIIQL
jgi:hypothetical protein